ncbi:MAG: Calx-beta domain-containing protein, partial [Planctomycetota bacterium]
AATGNSVGGFETGAGNLISGNAESDAQGISIGDATDTVVQGNLIGTDASGKYAVGNGIGVYVGGGSNNTIGGREEGAGNVISGNNSDGITLDSASGNVVEGNFIGVDVMGENALGNGENGVLIWAGFDNTIGDTEASSG